MGESTTMDVRGPHSRLFVAALMRDGARTRAARIFQEAVEEVFQQIGWRSRPVEELLGVAIENMRPSIGMKKQRVGDVSYTVPVLLDRKTSVAAAVRWIVDQARKRRGPMAAGLAKELLLALHG